MKKYLLVFASVFAFTLAFAQDENQTDTPQSSTNAIIEFDSRVKDFGILEFGGDGNHTFKFTNTGTTPLIISNVKSSCGCTVADGWPKEALAPGEGGDINVKYDTKRAGSFQKSITVYSNATENAVRLTIKGQVKTNTNKTVIGE